jgi:TolA-binding protein
MSVRHTWTILMVLALLPAFARAGEGEKTPADAPAAQAAQAAKSDESAEQLLDRAGQIRRQSFKKTGEEKRKILEESIAAYGAVAERFPKDERSCAEAAYRIGELHRSLGDTAAAAEAFEKVAAFGKSAPRYAARALNELGHILRRSGKGAEAIGSYQRVVAEFDNEETEGAKALIWIGKIQERAGDVESARKTWLSVAEKTPTQAVSAVRAADLAAVALLKGGQKDEARKVIEAVRKRFADSPYWTADVEEALEKMRAAKQLDGKAAGATADADEDDDA